MKRFITLLLIVLYITSFCSCSGNKFEISKLNYKIEENLTVDQYVSLSIKLKDQFRYNECIEVCKKVLQLSPDDVRAYNIMCIIYLTQNNWSEAIEVGEKALSINPQILQFYKNLFYGYSSINDWEKAAEISARAFQLNPNDAELINNLNEAKEHLKVAKIYNVLLITIIALVIILFCFTYFKKNKIQHINDFSPLDLFFLASSVSYSMYLLFYHFSGYIWSQNIIIPTQEFTPAVKYYSFEHDGIESYVLYLIMFIIILVSFSLTYFFSQIKNRTTYFLFSTALLIISCLYFFDINFIPPQNSLNSKSINASVYIGVVITLSLFSIINKYLPGKIFWIVTSIFLIPVCFIATEPISFFDYSFILAPGLKILNGFPISEIYFQYDLLLSLLAALWMKLHLDINHFQILGRISFYLFFIGAIIFAKQFFLNKKLPITLLIALILIRYYSIMVDPAALLQVTPLRLDLWLIVLLIVYFKGVYHWAVAAFLGLLVVIHKNLGIIYLIAYFELLFTFLCIEVIQLIINKEINLISLKTLLRKQLSLNLKNLLIIAGFISLSVILFKGFIAESAVMYQKIGIGMIQISKSSFFWYIPIIFSLIFALLLKYRKSLTSQYFSSGLLIIFLAIGNSMYFFGRSHEHNILNISGVLILSSFLLFDLLFFDQSMKQTVSLKENIKKNKLIQNKLSNNLNLKKIVISGFPILLIVGASYFYSQRISDKIKIQYKNFQNNRFIYPLNNSEVNIPSPTDFATIKKLTHGSKNVYFLNYDNDFLLYYYGNYIPQGYFNPCTAWVLNNELATFLQKLLNQNYFLVINDLLSVSELFPKISYNNIRSENGITVISKDSTDYTLPSNNKTILNIEMNNSLGTNGIELAPIELTNIFSIEMIVKPNSNQINNARIISNISDDIGKKGFIIQQNGSNQNQFSFTYGGGGNLILPEAMFTLNENQWNYIVVTVSGSSVNIYNNGKILYSGKAEFDFKNNDIPITIGNKIGELYSFNGLIKVVKINNDSISEQNILKNVELINSKIQ